MGKARPVSLFPLDFNKAMRGLVAVPKEAVEHVKPKHKHKGSKKQRARNGD